MSQRSQEFGSALETICAVEVQCSTKGRSSFEALNEGDDPDDAIDKLWNEVISFVDTYIVIGSPLRKRLALHVVASHHKVEDDEILKKGGDRVIIGQDSIGKFKARLQLFPRRVSRWLCPENPPLSQQESRPLSSTLHCSTVEAAVVILLLVPQRNNTFYMHILFCKNMLLKKYFMG